MSKDIKKYEIIQENTTTLAIGDYTIEFSGGNRKGNPYDLIEKLYAFGHDKTMSREEKNRDLDAIIREYMHNQ